MSDAGQLEQKLRLQLRLLEDFVDFLPNFKLITDWNSRVYL